MLASFTQSAGEPWTPKPVNKLADLDLRAGQRLVKGDAVAGAGPALRGGHDRHLAQIDQPLVQGGQARGKDPIIIRQQYSHRGQTKVPSNSFPQGVSSQTCRNAIGKGCYLHRCPTAGIVAGPTGGVNLALSRPAQARKLRTPKSRGAEIRAASKSETSSKDRNANIEPVPSTASRFGIAAFEVCIRMARASNFEFPAPGRLRELPGLTVVPPGGYNAGHGKVHAGERISGHEPRRGPPGGRLGHRRDRRAGRRAHGERRPQLCRIGEAEAHGGGPAPRSASSAERATTAGTAT